MSNDQRLTTPDSRRGRKLAPAGAMALLLVLGACGDGDDGEQAAQQTTTTSTTQATARQAGDVEEYCDKTFEVETLPEPEIDFESASEEEIAEALKQYANEQILPRANDIQAIAPEEVATDVATLVAATEEVAETGDFEAAFETPEAEAADDRLHEFALANCGWGQVDVTAVEYAFRGIDDTYEPGRVSFDLTNEGRELHELALVRKNEGVTESFEEILAAPEEEAMGKVTFVGQTMAAPGERAYVLADLEPGDYLAVCFIPVGLTPEVAAAAEEGGEEPQGPPHFTQGMRAEFTVE